MVERHPYRDPGDRSFITELVESVLQNALAAAPPAVTPRSSPFTNLLCDSHVSALNSLLEPHRLRITDVWSVADLFGAWRVCVEGPGGEPRRVDVRARDLHLADQNPLLTVHEAILREWSDVLSLHRSKPGDST